MQKKTAGAVGTGRESRWPPKGGVGTARLSVSSQRQAAKTLFELSSSDYLARAVLAAGAAFTTLSLTASSCVLTS